LLAPRPTPKLEDHNLSPVPDCLFNIFAATFNMGGPSCTRNPRTLRAEVNGTHLSLDYCRNCDRNMWLLIIYDKAYLTIMRLFQYYMNLNSPLMH